MEAPSKPRGSVPPMYVAEQFLLALGDNTVDNLRAKIEHDAEIDLFILNAQVVKGPRLAEMTRQVEQGELFPVFTAYTNIRSRLRKVNQ